MCYYNVLDLSDYIISKCIKDKKMISNLQLQKILYYIQKYYLITKGKPAFDYPIQAWKIGPVVSLVYYKYCGSGAMPIRRIVNENYRQIHELNIKDKAFIDKIIEEKRELSPWKMSADVNKKDGAWDRVFKKGKGNHNIIPL